MPHDKNKVLLENIPWSAKDISNFAVADPATFPAGLAVHVTSTGTLSLAKSAGMFAGVSMGRDLADDKRTAVARTGGHVPILIADGFTPTIGAPVFISDTTGVAGADDTGMTVTNAIYISGVLTGVYPDGTTANAALIDMPGGL